jgi:hypothetical protein
VQLHAFCLVANRHTADFELWNDSIHEWWERSGPEDKAEFAQRFCSFAGRVEPRLASGEITCTLADLAEQPDFDYDAIQGWTVCFKVDAGLPPNWQNELRRDIKFEGFHGVGMRVRGVFRPVMGREGWRFRTDPIPEFPANASHGRGDVPVPEPPTQELLKSILVNVDDLVTKLSRCRPYHELAREHIAIYEELSAAHASDPRDQARIDAAEREWVRVRASLEKRGGSASALSVHTDDVLHAAQGTIVFCIAVP